MTDAGFVIPSPSLFVIPSVARNLAVPLRTGSARNLVLIPLST